MGPRDRRPRRWAAGQRGQVIPLVAGLLALLAASALLLGVVAGALVDRARAQTAADAAALAAAAGSDPDAAALAAANGARLTSLRRDGDTVEVTVQVGRAAATARASSALIWRPPPTPAGGRPPGLGADPVQ